MGVQDATDVIHADEDSIWMLTNGSAKNGVSGWESAKLAPFALVPPPDGAASVTRTFTINQTDPVIWVVDKVPYVESQIPVVFGNVSDGWNLSTTLHMPSNATVDIIMQISDQSMDTVSARRPVAHR